MKKTLALLLVLLMLMPMLFSCKKQDKQPNTDDTVVQDEEEIPVLVENLGKGDTPKEFNIWYADCDFADETLTVEEPTTTLDSEIWERNMVVEDRLNCLITATLAQSVYYIADNVRIIHQSGEAAYDLYYFTSWLGLPLSIQGVYVGSDELDLIDFSGDWWDVDAQNGLAIHGNAYTLVGAAALQYYDSYMMMAYNKSIAEARGMPNLAEVALDGEWTWEKLYQYTVEAYDDKHSAVEGESVGDTFGFTSSYELMTYALISSGDDIITYDEDNYPSFSGFSSRTITIFDQIRDWFYNRDETFIAEWDCGKLGVTTAFFHDVFTDGNCLFYIEPIGSLEKLRDVEFEFTVLPLPKWETRDQYLTMVSVHTYAFFVPAVTEDLRPVSILLDNLNYQSHKDVTPVYVEEIVTLQRVRNEDSYKILNEIILPSEKKISLLMAYDFAELYSKMREIAATNTGLGSLGAGVSRTFASKVAQAIGPKP